MSASDRLSQETQTLIETLGLEPHMEGGYFRRTHASYHRPELLTNNGPRLLSSAIYYLLTAAQPAGAWHRNESDILHCFHQGGPIEYRLIYPDGRAVTCILGNDLAAGHQPQLFVAGGVWKASCLLDGPHGLVSEAVVPAFDYADMVMASADDLVAAFPELEAFIREHDDSRVTMEPTPLPRVQQG